MTFSLNNLKLTTQNENSSPLDQTQPNFVWELFAGEGGQGEGSKGRSLAIARGPPIPGVAASIPIKEFDIRLKPQNLKFLVTAFVKRHKYNKNGQPHRVLPLHFGFIGFLITFQAKNSVASTTNPNTTAPFSSA